MVSAEQEEALIWAEALKYAELLRLCLEALSMQCRVVDV
jgi:hypothetical protein